MMNKKNVYKLFLFLFMLLAFFISVYPLLWVVIQSLKTETEFLESIWTLPARLNFQNYATAWNDAGMSRYFMNSVVVTLVTTAVNLVFVTCAGYAFAKLKFPGKTFFYYMIIFNLLIPTAIILLPMFRCSAKSCCPWQSPSWPPWPFSRPCRCGMNTCGP